MSILEWLFTGSIVLAILLFVLSIFFFFRYITFKKEGKKIEEKRKRSKRYRKRYKREMTRIVKSEKKNFRGSIFLLVLSIIFGLSTFYVSYYQSITLSVSDEEAIVKSYYLIRDFEGQINILQEGTEDTTKTVKNISYLAGNMSSYNIKKASDLNDIDKQRALNKYYNSIKELGMNGVTQASKLPDNKELREEFLGDIEKVKANEKIVFDLFKVDESSFSIRKEDESSNE